ncbi:1-deoxy-D-xylulose-5-phosphate reductoisomerase [Acholeplasma sp. OttesenSCG-928-E16]|nr:1-deoxy-D-xylulose-5-phosphate reductoisomerase [Acholeplasma sp. OttesenSCG-928-E16]
MRNIYILGATGSIGQQTLEVIRELDEFKLIGVSLGTDDTLNHQILKDPNIEIACLRNDDKLKDYQDKYKNIYFVVGDSGLLAISKYKKRGVLVNALSGSVGLLPTIEAIKAKKDIALANKESLVMAGDIINDLLIKYNVNLYPIDSEHSAIFQLINNQKINEVKKIVITASGGAFRDKSRDELLNVTLEDALKHPNWSMGPKITIDSATMANKCLEIIEAHHLFKLPFEKIETILHKESIVHGLVYFCDSTVTASFGSPDMRIPIQYSLTYPKRRKNDYPSLELKDLSFQKMDFDRFPLIKLTYDVLSKKGLYPTIFNAANEAAVNMFLNGKINFLEIESIIFDTINRWENIPKPLLEEIVKADKDVKESVYQMFGKGSIK